jgi:hypothetical protein
MGVNWCIIMYGVYHFENEVDNLLQCEVDNFHLHRVHEQRSQWE